jgi:kumamolisin
MHFPRTLNPIFVMLLLCSIFAHGQTGNLLFNPHHQMVEPSASRLHPYSIALASAPDSAPSGETPGSIACIYGLVPDTYGGCNIATATATAQGGSGTIYIVDAFDYPQAEADLNTFSSQFGLPPCTTADGCFQKVYSAGVKPWPDCGWSEEQSLDIEWAHAMAPAAKIVLVESPTASNPDMIQAVEFANALIQSENQQGSAILSMSWGSPDTKANHAYDSAFAQPGVIYISSAGDFGAANSSLVLSWPATSSLVIAAGGTSIVRDTKGNFVQEIAWETTQHCTPGGNCYPGCNSAQLLAGHCVGGGGGVSPIEPRPGYQAEVSKIVGQFRGTPDFSADANPNTGVSVYDSFACQGDVDWRVFGGTSLSSPLLAGIISSAASHHLSASDELTPLYDFLGGNGYTSIFHDIATGFDGSFRAIRGYDLATGLGTPKGLTGF